jgi:hypothetical protein
MPWLFSFSLASFPDRGEHFFHTRKREGREDGCVSNSAKKASTSINRYRMSEPIFSPRILGERRVVWSRTQRSDTPSCDENICILHSLPLDRLVWSVDTKQMLDPRQSSGS